jgi:hypothetical protein
LISEKREKGARYIQLTEKSYKIVRLPNKPRPRSNLSNSKYGDDEDIQTSISQQAEGKGLDHEMARSMVLDSLKN